MNAISNVMLAPRRVYRKSRRELQQPVERLFVRFGLQDQMYKYPDQLSGGQQQRVAIVRALAMDPQVMLFDEITSALDPQLVGEVLDVLLKLKQDGMTILMATHEINFARKAANKICFLKDGRVLGEGSPECIHRSKTAETAVFLAFLAQLKRKAYAEVLKAGKAAGFCAGISSRSAVPALPKPAVDGV